MLPIKAMQQSSIHVMTGYNNYFIQRYPDYCYNPKRRTSDPAVVNVESTNEDTSQTTTRPISNHPTSRSARQTTPSYSQASSLASSQTTLSQATSDYDDWEELDTKSQCAIRNSNSTGIDIWGKLENESYPGGDCFYAANSNDCAMDMEDGALTFSASSSASSSSSQVTLQEYNPGYEPFMDCGIYVDTMHSSSTKWWHEPEESTSLVNGAILPPFEGLTSRGLQYIPSLDNFDYNAF
jgi:hypothetical protein